ncbi:MAG TPA: hypothetical protein VJ739_03095, partial [Gemmataceae bacterium]|nr:hypothetical protein [Gemmataceae bacterium]
MTAGRGGLVLWAGVAAALALSQPAAAGEGGGKEAAGPIPVRQFQPLGGKAVGLLVGGGDGVLAGEGRRGPADALWFSTGGASYRAVYVPVAKRFLIGGLNVPVGERGEKTRRFNKLSPATPKTLAPSGVAGPCALVEVEVNGGLGGPAGETFVATSVKVLDGTREYPLHTAAVVEQLRRLFAHDLKEQEGAVVLGLGEARARMPAGHRLLAGREQ